VQIRDLPIFHVDLFLVHSNVSLIAKYRSNLLQRQAIGVGEEEPNDQSTNRAGDNENEVEFPPDGNEGSRRGL
jgi:hypothetical protein